jgi:hypothetical protein
MSIIPAGAIMLTLGLGKTGQAAVINFDSLSPGEIVDNQFLNLGVDFNGTPSVLTLGDGLDPTYPPVSGNNLVYNYPSNLISVNAVGSTWDSVGAYITGIGQITLTAYDAENRVIGTTSTSGSNYLNADTGLAPNIFLKVASSNIAYVRFMAENGLSDNSFTLDNFTFEPSPAYCPLP